jgi:hypothetical protein
MNLASLNTASMADQGVVMVVKHPVEMTPLVADDGQQVTLTLLGQDSDAFIKSGYKQAEAAQEVLMEKGKLSPPAMRDHNMGATLAACTVGWHGVPAGWVTGKNDDMPIDFSTANAEKLYNNRGMRWLREQVEKFIAERANFLNA